MKNFTLLTGLLIFAALTFAHVPQNTLIEDGIRTGGDTTIFIPGLNPASMIASGNELLMPDEAVGKATQSHVIEFSQGWSGFSSYVNPENPGIESLFLAVQDQLIILYNQTGIYMPSQQVNTLVNWDPQSGYIAKFAQEATIEFSGQKIQNGMLSLTAGWNLIPVLSSCPVNVETLFTNSGVEVVKEVAGWKLYWPGFDINTINELLPGNAYYVLMNSPAEISFPDCGMPQWQCGDPIIDSRDNQSYNTVQIGDQCWMAENLNIGAMILATQAQSDNSVFEKYCYNGTQDSCDVYGGLYQWDEMMQYDTIAGRRGICLSGWHLPTDEEWKVLEGASDSQFNYPDPEWDKMGFRGFDACKNLKTPNGWWINTGIDLFGFSAKPGGNVSTEGQYENFSNYAHFWTSSLTSQSLGGGAYKRSLGGGSNQSNRFNNHTLYAFSVRCIKDAEPQPWSCGDPIIDSRDNQSYNTVQIGDQCWMAENLDIGTMIEPSQTQLNNSIIEKYCYNGTQDSCDVYGGLYQWNEMMQYDTIAGRRGICPSGWHLPTDEEWKKLEGAADSQFGYPDAEWNSTGFRGYDAGKNLKSKNKWVIDGFGVDLFGFDVLPAGNVSLEATYDNMGQWADFWTSTLNPASGWGISRDFGHYSDEAWRDIVSTNYAFSVRCIKDTEPQPWSCGDPIIDTRDNQSYNTVQIGDQCWMAQNLNVGVQVSPYLQSDNGIIEKLCYNNDPENCIESGGLYEWSEIMNYTSTESSQGICPDGWHIPAEVEWDELIMSQGGSAVAGGKLKEAGFGHWDEPNSGATNESGFTALGGGLFAYDNYDGFRQWGGYWTSSKLSVEPINHFLYYLSEEVSFYSWELQNHPNFHLRCIKDIEQPTWSCGNPLLDSRNNQSYNTVQIGDQCWMAENMNVGTMINGTTQTDNGVLEKYCTENDEANCDIYGGLYEWPEAMQYMTNAGAQGICPEGWQIPKDGDWLILENYLGGETVAGGKMKSTGTIEAGTGFWYAPNTAATNESGFNGFPAGIRAFNDGSFMFMGSDAYFWTSSMYSNASSAFWRNLNFGYDDIVRDAGNGANGFSVRCIKVCSPEPTQSSAGPDQLNVPGTSTVLEGNAPTNGTGLWSVVSGTGGTIVSPASPTSEFHGLEGNEYILNWAISTACGISTDNVTISFGYTSFTCGNALVYEGQSYATILIGDQCWMAENLNVGEMVPGSQNQVNNQTIEKYCFGDNLDNCDEFGGFYQWDEMMQYEVAPGGKGICPDGWHIPSETEWCTMAMTLDPTVDCNNGAGLTGTDIGFKLKSTSGWNSGGNGSNSSGFNALPAGQRYSYGNFYYLGDYAYFWSSYLDIYENWPWYNGVSYDTEAMNRSAEQKEYGFSVRCVKDVQVSWSCGDPIHDVRDNRNYSTVAINDQCWMAENLNVGTLVNPYEQSNNGIIEKLCYNNDPSVCDEYGGLYEWNEMMNYSMNQTNQGICPEGWRVPKLSEWESLIDYLGGASVAGGKMKEAGFTHWDEPNTGATNESGFTALGGGRFSDGYGLLNQYANFWTSFFNGEDQVKKYVRYNESSIESGYSYYEYRNAGSVRCIKDNEPQSWACGNPINDARDNQPYNTVQIGDQCWMAENLNYGTMIPAGSSPTTGSKYCYDDLDSNCQEYGGFYPWSQMMAGDPTPGSQGICPDGFHVPADEEWIALMNYLGGFSAAGGKMKESGYIHWLEPNEGATNESGFTALGTGIINPSFPTLNTSTYMWSSTPEAPGKAWYRRLAYNSSGLYREKTHGMAFPMSVRCLKDSDQ